MHSRCATHGLYLLALVCNTYVASCNTRVAGADAASFKTWSEAFVAVQACGASIGCLMVKSGALPSQLKPYEDEDPPPQVGQLVQGTSHYPRTTWELRCGRVHNRSTESERNRGGHCAQSAQHRRPNATNKGVPRGPATFVLQLIVLA